MDENNKPIIWKDREGNLHDVATMDPGHAANIIRHLERRAPALLERYADWSLANLPDDEAVGEMALDRLEREVHRLWDLAEKAREDPQVAVDWLWEYRKELMTALSLRTVAS